MIVYLVMWIYIYIHYRGEEEEEGTHAALIWGTHLSRRNATDSLGGEWGNT